MRASALIPAAVLVASCGQPAPILDADRCLAHVERQVKIGERPSGSPGIEKAREWILSELKASGLEPVVDRFAAETHRGPMAMANVRVEIAGDSPGVVALVSHYDSKLLPGVTFVGANDPGSSVAVVLEVARHFATHRPPIGLRIVFVDGEETQASKSWDDSDSLYGSRHEAKRLATSGEVARTKVVIVLDMIGDRDLNVLRESRASDRLVGWFREAAEETGCASKFFATAQAMTDDHVPFLEAGVADVIDLIDFSYGPPGNTYWHTAQDTLDKISKESLRLVGDVVIRAIPKIAHGLTR